MTGTGALSLGIWSTPVFGSQMIGFKIRYPDVLRPVQASAYKMAAAIHAAAPNASEEQLLEAAKTVLREKAGSYPLLPLPFTPPPLLSLIAK